jgi:hypothetical protein
MSEELAFQNLKVVVTFPDLQMNILGNVDGWNTVAMEASFQDVTTGHRQ